MEGCMMWFLFACSFCLVNAHMRNFEEFEAEFYKLKERVSQQENALLLQGNKLIEQDQRLKYYEHALGKRFVLQDEETVAFTAHVSPYTLDHLNHLDVIHFDQVLTNIGGGYNNQTGVFVAPVSGIYQFSCSLMDHISDTHGDAMVRGEIIHNSMVIARVFAHADVKYRDQGAQTVFVHVNVGDQVFVRVRDNTNLSLGGDMYSSFSGYLMQPVETP
ncbi:cerebellin-3-like [Mya arenaria]|uniref:cerebellin-3-like n=1 Tax=Mya arenaria TaxID=6604 RepID=UPI0022E2A8AE|nr:cerebellin-3-like [Mya arenaria]